MVVWRGVMMAAVLSGLAGCAGKDDVADAQQAVQAFHHQLDAGDYRAIWSGTGQAMRDATSEGDFDKLLAAIHGKLGTVKSSQSTGWRVNYTTGGTFKMLDQQTVFGKGKGLESFVFQVKDKNVQLVGYHINSMQLITG